ncbi:MAG: hypothetical protein M1274_15635 [Actinobacteria bacterium]|nr:hypothetical protein [Actinomycetota bacterium]
MGPYSIFKWQRKNVFLIVLTGHCLQGIRRFRRFFAHPKVASFEIPHSSTVSVKLSPHPARLGLMKVVDITYRDAEGVREKSIATYNRFAEGA